MYWDTELYFFTIGVTIANWAKLQQKLYSTYFLSKRYFSLFNFKNGFASKIEDN